MQDWFPKIIKNRHLISKEESAYAVDQQVRINEAWIVVWVLYETCIVGHRDSVCALGNNFGTQCAVPFYELRKFVVF